MTYAMQGHDTPTHVPLHLHLLREAIVVVVCECRATWKQKDLQTTLESLFQSTQLAGDAYLQ